MKPASQLICKFLAAGLFVSVLFAVAIRAEAEPLTLKHAVELALTHSPAAGQTAADEQRAFASLNEARNQYIPQAVVGSGLGDSWGYPLSLEGTAPSLVNINAQSVLFNPALRDYIHAARIDYQATGEGSKDRRNQIVQDTVLTYLELIKWEQLIDHLRQEFGEAQKAEQVVEQRIKEGVDTVQLRNQARLVSARANLHLAQAEDALDLLRASLSQLTGLPAATIQTDAGSVPALPEVKLERDAIDQAAAANPAVLFAQQHAIAQGFRARAEHRSLWPSVDFATQYAVLATFNNWQQFFPHAFQRNNASLGVVIRFPFFNASQRAHAEAADAEAIHAGREAQSAKNQVSQEVLKLQHSVRQLTAAKEISDLEYEIAKSNVDSLEVRMNSGTATIHDLAGAKAEMSEKYAAVQDSNFELLRARIGLLRAMGDLQSWVERSP